MRGAFGALLLVGGLVVAALGAVWTFLAVVGREWDYCSSSDCIPGELAGGVLVGVGVAGASLGLTLIRTRGQSP